MHIPKHQQAEQFLQQGKLEAALACYEQMLQDHPQDPDILHTVSMLHAKTGDLSKALGAINQALEMKPNYAPFYNSKGNILLRLNQLPQATQAYQQAIDLKPDYAIGYSSLGRCYYLQNKLLAAKKSYQKAIALDKNLSDAHYNYGVLLAKLGEDTQAITEFNTVLHCSPQFAAAYDQMAALYLQKQEFTLAIEILHRRLALTENPTLPTLFNLGLAYLGNQNFNQAITFLEKVLIQDPHYPECNHYLGTAYLQQADYGKSLTYFFRELEVTPSVATYYNIAVLLMYQERHQEAITYFKTAAAMDPGYLPTHLNLGALYLKIQAVPEAIQHYQQAALIKPSDPEIRHILNALTQTGESDKAPAEYLQHLFDQYAPYYDKHLVEYLKYKVPQELHQLITQEAGLKMHEWIILDLGCGTGLCGTLFKQYSKKLIGIDLSQQMIDAAQQKQLYDELKIKDLSEALTDYHQSIDLIIAADVFTYIGKLDDIFSKVYQALKIGGWFAFSVEKGENEPYQLQQSIRYAHSREYLEDLIKRHHFEKMALHNIMLRKQKQGHIEGYIALLRRPIN